MTRLSDADLIDVFLSALRERHVDGHRRVEEETGVPRNTYYRMQRGEAKRLNHATRNRIQRFLAATYNTSDRLDRIRVRIAERKGWAVLAREVRRRGGEVYQNAENWPRLDAEAVTLLPEIAADGWTWQMWNGSEPGRVSCRAERDVDSHLVTDCLFAEALSLLWLMCMGEDVSDLMEKIDG